MYNQKKKKKKAKWQINLPVKTKEYFYKVM